MYLIPGYLNILEQHGVGEQAGHVQAWQWRLPTSHSPFPNIPYKVTVNQECLFPAFNTFWLKQIQEKTDISSKYCTFKINVCVDIKDWKQRLTEDFQA